MTVYHRIIIPFTQLLVVCSLGAQNRPLSQMYELPAFSEKPLFYSAYTVQFNTKTNTPDWVAWRFDNTRLPNSNVTLIRGKFQKDENLVNSPTHDDYTNTSYTRGHMCPARDCTLPGLWRESFLMSNVCPQKQVLNGGRWGRLEDKCFSWIQNGIFNSLYIICGPIPDEIETIIGPPERRIIVPKRFFKAIVAEKKNGDMQGIAIIMNQEGKCEEPLSIDRLERLIHLDLFTNIPLRKQRRIEKMEPSIHDWPDLYIVFL